MTKLVSNALDLPRQIPPADRPEGPALLRALRMFNISKEQYDAALAAQQYVHTFASTETLLLRR